MPAALDDQPAGSGIRALELAGQLREHADLTLGVPGAAPGSIDGMPCVSFHPHDPSGMATALAGADAVLTTPCLPRVMRALRRSGARLVFDLYDPEPLELVPGFPGLRPSIRRALAAFSIDRVTAALRIGHQFLCSSERQRDLWLGLMLAERLLDTGRYDSDPSMRSLIDVVPFGLPEDPPTPGPGPRERFAAIGPHDEVILWNGGLWPWFDAATPIRAVAELAERRSARLVFMGAAPSVPAQRAAARAKDLARKLGVLDRHVFFNDEWVPYEARGGWLLESSCAVSAHADQLETRFSFRTRLLDCIWAGLPIICTTGDDLSELVEHEQVGATVPPGDARALATALEEVLNRDRSNFESAFAAVRRRFTWAEVSKRLVGMLGEPPPPRPRPRHAGAAEAARRGSYLLGRRVLDLVGVRDWPRV
jgi:glycosyltransferase involved in cell wall biosynthesis